MTEEKELQKKILTYRILEARLNSLLKQREAVAKEIMEIQTTLESIEEMKNSEKGILFSLGSDAYATGKILDKKKVIVGIGAGIALEKNVEEAKEFLKKRIDELNGILKDVEKNSIEISQSIDKLSSEIQKSTQKAG